MLKTFSCILKYNLFLILLLTSNSLFADSFNYNSYNNHGVVGLINMPTARFFDEGTHGFTFYKGNPDNKITLTASPYNWMEASVFYANVRSKRYCADTTPVCRQSYKDKGFNFKFRLKQEGRWPAIAVGLNDISGTGLYSSEYIVGSYGINNTDFHFGVGWGALNGSSNKFRNPLGYIYDGFNERPKESVGFNTQNKGGKFSPAVYFSDKNVSPFFGISHVYNEKIHFNLEYDTTLTPGFMEYEKPESNFSLSFNYRINKNLSIGISNERGTHSSISFVYKLNPKSYADTSEAYKKSEYEPGDNQYTKFIRNVEANGIGVNKIVERADSIGVELTTFRHPNLNVIEEIISFASVDAGIDKEIKTDLRIADLQASSQYDINYENAAELIYQRESIRKFNTSNKITFRPFLGAREGFFKGAILLENDSEYIIKDNFFFTSNLKYSLWNNFSNLTVPPRDTFPAQVRSDVKDYLRSFDNGVFIGRAQFDYHITPKKNHHVMFTAGIFEEMFQGFGGEYLFYKPDTNYAIGVELFQVKKRDYEMRFGTLDYENITGYVNYYYRNYGSIPFDMKISAGEYLAGDVGATIEFSRTYKNGINFGVFATFTDVSTRDFGEGSFDKGIFFNIPIYGNLINYTWRPLTKDPGAVLNRKNTIHDLLIRFRPIN